MRRKKRWHFGDLDKVELDPDERWFEVIGDLPGGIKVKSPTKRDVAEQFKFLVDKKTLDKSQKLA